MRKNIITILCGLACGSLPLVAQEPAKAPAAPSSQFQVQLPVTVRDKHGDLVPDLQKSDLSLTEDGRPQTIVTLERNPATPLRAGLLLDTSRAMSGVSGPEGRSAGAFVDAILPAQGATGNQVFLIHFDREVELLRDFTDSREKLHSELDDLGGTHAGRFDVQSPDPDSSDRTSASRPGHNGTQLYDAIYLAADELMKGKDGRKFLILFSDGADRGSRETLNDAIDAADRANLAIYTIFFKGEQERDAASELPQGRRRGGMGGGWPGSGGGGYPGGGSGRRGSDPKAANGADGKKILEQIARRTGGHAYEAKKKEDFDPIYKLINEELQGQYWLTYTPDKSDNPDGFHKVVITPSNKDLSVSTREGYYPPGADSSR